MSPGKTYHEVQIELLHKSNFFGIDLVNKSELVGLSSLINGLQIFLIVDMVNDASFWVLVRIHLRLLTDSHDDEGLGISSMLARKQPGQNVHKVIIMLNYGTGKRF